MDGWWTLASPVELKWSVKQLEIYSSSPITHYIFIHTSRMKLLPVHFDVTTLIILIAIINVNIFILLVKINYFTIVESLNTVLVLSNSLTPHT